MSDEKKNKAPKAGKKELNRDIQEKMGWALADFRENLGEKEFISRIKKASKLFSRGLNKSKKKKDEAKLKEKKNGKVVEVGSPQPANE